MNIILTETKINIEKEDNEKYDAIIEKKIKYFHLFR